MQIASKTLNLLREVYGEDCRVIARTLKKWLQAMFGGLEGLYLYAAVCTVQWKLLGTDTM